MFVGLCVLIGFFFISFGLGGLYLFTRPFAITYGAIKRSYATHGRGITFNYYRAYFMATIRASITSTRQVVNKGATRSRGQAAGEDIGGLYGYLRFFTYIDTSSATTYMGREALYIFGRFLGGAGFFKISSFGNSQSFKGDLCGLYFIYHCVL